MIEESVEPFTERMGDRKGDSAPNLAVQVRHPRLWPTPKASDGAFAFPRTSEHKGCGPLGSNSHQHWLEKRYLHAEVQQTEQATGQLNPQWVDWLIGFPTGWTGLEQPETQLSLKSPN